MTPPRPFIVRGHSGHLYVPILAIPAITAGAFTYYRDHLPEFCLENAGMVVALSGLLTLVLAIVAVYRKARHVDVRGEQLRYRSWLSDRTVRLSEISTVSFETEVGGGGDQTATTEHYLSLWSGDELLVRFNSALWPRTGLQALLRHVKDAAPGVRFDRDVERYMEARGRP